MTHGSTAEFDAHAQDYDAGMDNKLKALAGESADAFVAVKVAWMLHRWPELRTDAAWSILDYGCGTATLLRLLRTAGVAGRLSGTDVSTGMLQEAVRRWPAGSPPPQLRQQNGAATGLPAGAFDLAVIGAVLHHVPTHSRHEVYAELHRVLRPDGRLVVFEHNPRNPVTRYVVARTPIDRNAVLLPSSEVRTALARGGWHDIRTSHLMFLPPRLGWLASTADRALHWLPLGGQYSVTARK